MLGSSSPHHLHPAGPLFFGDGLRVAISWIERPLALAGQPSKFKPRERVVLLLLDAQLFQFLAAPRRPFWQSAYYRLCFHGWERIRFIWVGRTAGGDLWRGVHVFDSPDYNVDPPDCNVAGFDRNNLFGA